MRARTRMIALYKGHRRTNEADRPKQTPVQVEQRLAARVGGAGPGCRAFANKLVEDRGAIALRCAVRNARSAAAATMLPPSMARAPFAVSSGISKLQVSAHLPRASRYSAQAQKTSIASSRRSLHVRTALHHPNARSTHMTTDELDHSLRQLRLGRYGRRAFDPIATSPGRQFGAARFYRPPGSRRAATAARPAHRATRRRPPAFATRERLTLSIGSSTRLDRALIFEDWQTAASSSSTKTCCCSATPASARATSRRPPVWPRSTPVFALCIARHMCSSKICCWPTPPANEPKRCANVQRSTTTYHRRPGDAKAAR